MESQTTEINQLNFRLGSKLGDKLKLTGEAILIEHTPHDRYWADGGDGTGSNMLGRLLMELREQLQAEIKS